MFIYKKATLNIELIPDTISPQTFSFFGSKMIPIVFAFLYPSFQKQVKLTDVVLNSTFSFMLIYLPTYLLPVMAF